MIYDDWHSDFFWAESRTPPTEFNLAVRRLVVKLFNIEASGNELPFFAVAPEPSYERNKCLIRIGDALEGCLLRWDLYNEPDVWNILCDIFSLDFTKYIRVEVSVDEDFALEGLQWLSQ